MYVRATARVAHDSCPFPCARLPHVRSGAQPLQLAVGLATHAYDTMLRDSVLGGSRALRRAAAEPCRPACRGLTLRSAGAYASPAHSQASHVAPLRRQQVLTALAAASAASQPTAPGGTPLFGAGTLLTALPAQLPALLAQATAAAAPYIAVLAVVVAALALVLAASSLAPPGTAHGAFPAAAGEASSQHHPQPQ